MRNISTRICVLALMFAVAGFVRATEPEVLWWRVDEGDTVNWYGTDITAQDLATIKGGELYAKVSVRNAAGEHVTYLDLYTFDENAQVIPSGEQKTQQLGVPPVNSFADLTGYSGAEWSFAVELGNTVDDKWMAYVVSEVRSYASLGRHITDWRPGMDSVHQIEWVPKSFVVPEPCSGLLLLVGGGLLALRRRRNV